jgi:hypothetical protein
VVALTYRATVVVPARFRKSKSVGAIFGLTCSKYQSGEIDDQENRSSITGAAAHLLHVPVFEMLGE